MCTDTKLTRVRMCVCTCFNRPAFLLNHSREYHLALVLSSVEFWLEFAFVPEWKRHWAVLPTGLVLVVVGQALRVAAMATAAANFSHRIEYQKRQEHVLVTHGVYRFVRHPSYMGWFLWTIGSQVLLANPICGIGYTIVSWGFFRDRIPYVVWACGCGWLCLGMCVCSPASVASAPYCCYCSLRYEERLLMGFFPEEYPQYRARTISGIPFV